MPYMSNKWQVMVSQQTHNPILVMGAGAWGTALALLLHRHNVPVRWWTHSAAQAEQVNSEKVNTRYLPTTKIPDDLSLSADLELALDGVQDVLIVVPSMAFFETINRLKQLKPAGLRLAWATKGLDAESHQLLHEVVAHLYGSDTAMAVISGPSFAKEVAQAMPTAVSLASNDAAFAATLTHYFHSSTFRVYANPDMTGVELCGVFKNILAIGVGICDGFGLGANTRSALITRGLAEMTRLCLALGGQSQTAMSLAGVGDVILTCTDNQSRNRRFGVMLGQGMTADEAKVKINQAIEGHANVQQLYALAKEQGIETPIVNAIYQVLYGGSPIQSQVDVLMGRDSRAEY